MGSRSIRAQWINTIAFTVVAAVLYFVRVGNGLGSLILPVVALAVAVASSPMLKRKSVSHDEAVASRHDVIIYHRAGCTFCMRMKAMLTGVGKKAAWVDIWDDEEAAAYVRLVNDGNETVPTVVIDGRPHTNPSPSVVRAALS